MRGLALGLPTLWTALYTAGLPADVRDRRREEIASDLFEQLQDLPEWRQSSPAFEVAWATLKGIPDDLAWRTSQLSAGWWLAEFVALAGGMTFCGVYAALGALYITNILDGLPSILIGSTMGAVLGLWMAIALRRFRPIDLSVPEAQSPPDVDNKGDPGMPRTFRTWAGLAAIIAAVIQVAVFGAYAAGADLNPWAEPATMLRGVDDHALAWAVMTIGTSLIPIFLVPLFIILTTEGGSFGRQWGSLATVLLAIHASVNLVGFGLASQLVEVTNAYTKASPADQITLLQQTDLVQHVWAQLRILGGVPLMLAMFVAAALCFRTNVLPRWLGIVAVVLGLQFVPPIGGEFILEPPAMAAWALGAGFIMLRRRPSAASAEPFGYTGAPNVEPAS